jgi:hypothetical protein
MRNQSFIPKWNVLVLVLILTSHTFSQSVTISNFTPLSASSGTLVTINGSGFSLTPFENIVHFGPVRGKVVGSTTNQISVVVPVTATYDRITVTVGNYTASSPRPFNHQFTGIGSIVNGTFASAVEFPAANSGPFSMIVSDMDGDTIPDLAIEHLYGNSVGMYRSIGIVDTIKNYHFSYEADYGAGFFPYTIHRIDVNHDGNLDIITVPYYSPFFSIFTNTSTMGTIGFQPRIDIALNPVGTKFSIAEDLDNDGKCDIAICVQESSATYIFRNTSTPSNVSFQFIGSIPSSSTVSGIISTDLDGDGKPELIFSDNSSNYIAIKKNIGSPGTIMFGSDITINISEKSASVDDIDADSDGRIDLIVSSDENRSFMILRNISVSGNITFDLPTHFQLSGFPITTTVNDIDGDGKPDILISTTDSTGVDIFENYSAANISFTKALQIPLINMALGLASADMNGDEAPEVIVTDLHQNTFSLFQNFSSRVSTVNTNAGWNLVSLPRVPIDRTPHEVFRNSVPGSISGFTGNLYFIPDSLRTGNGYWAYYYSGSTESIAGVSINSYSLLVPTGNRWILIGSISNPTSINNIVVSPISALAPGSLFGFNGSQYTIPTLLEPGKGYWMFVFQPCIISVTP